MRLPLRNRKFRRLVLLIVLTWSALSMVLWQLRGSVWTTWDMQVLDAYFKHAVRRGYGPPTSSQIVYVPITDAWYSTFGTNMLDRADVAQANDALAFFGAGAVAYDIIFARPSNPPADARLTTSLAAFGAAYMPIGLGFSEQPRAFLWEAGPAYERFRREYLKQPVEIGPATPLYATRAVMQMDEVAQAALNAGHIGVTSDADGVYRHAPLLLKVDTRYFPTLALAMFLDHVRVPFERVVVHWGRDVTIPALPGTALERDVVIPIDAYGRVFIPYVQTWGHDFAALPAHTLLHYRAEEALHGNVTEFVEGKFVFVADISIGTSDIGNTPLESDVPLVAMHAALLNGLLTNTFYRAWSFWDVHALLGVAALLLGLAALPRSSWVLYLTGGVVLLGLVGLTWLQVINFRLFPVVTVGGSLSLLGIGLIIGLQVVTSKDQAFIRGAFAKYVPETVVNELLVHPELLQLQGEERVLSVLFSDLENFTTIAEQMAPAELVRLLNEYLSEMTGIILAAGGIIDKYQGDAIMAEFGAPLALPDHADVAVGVALHMQRRLGELRQVWAERGLPALRCRVGINTGPMLVGNMGSHQVFDYTVIGDAVNLAARLESANKLYGTCVMISEFTHAGLTPGKFCTRAVDMIRVKGKTKAVKVYEVYGDTDESISPDAVAYYTTYDAAFEAYLARHFAFARQQFVHALTLRPRDPAAHRLIERIDALHPHDLPDDWDGSVALTSK
jgi:adenylate cyclase